MMQFISVLSAMLLAGLVWANEPVPFSIVLDEDTSISCTIETFNKAGNKVTDCGNGYICLVNDKPVWGADGKVPKTAIKKLIAVIKGKNIELETTGMFNPMLAGTDKHRFQVVNYYDDVWKVRGKFSDGAAVYYAEWLVTNGHAMRVMIGDSELLYDAFDHIFKKK